MIPENIHPSNGRSLEIPRGRGVLKGKLLEEKNELMLNWTYLGGEGVQNKKPSIGEHGYFLELHNVTPALDLFNFFQIADTLVEMMRRKRGNFPSKVS